PWRARPGAEQSDYRLLPTFEKLLETLVPSRRMATMATTAMRATRRPYSSSEAPASSFRSNFASSQVLRMNRSMVTSRGRGAVWCAGSIDLGQRSLDGPGAPIQGTRSGGSARVDVGRVRVARAQTVPEEPEAEDGHQGDERQDEAVLHDGSAGLGTTGDGGED